jgi:hypothetical protein
MTLVWAFLIWKVGVAVNVSIMPGTKRLGATFMIASPNSVRNEKLLQTLVELD